MSKYRYTYWKVINNLLLTRNHLSRIMNISSSHCPVCNLENESHDHLFRECIFTKKAVDEIGTWLELESSVVGHANWSVYANCLDAWSTSMLDCPS
ncbi:hypothetical protein F8388_019063 [Cannabis sativa]|uniref:Reverse transcriptase zinc-binding domain-containing protein n=1 Tax=Cannabis sativa TaxID=3483 RepID=A0A7J6FCC6_CANSA|nr:hypothetical protein F8388_019063 [Cannabis sativa]